MSRQACENSPGLSHPEPQCRGPRIRAHSLTVREWCPHPPWVQAYLHLLLPCRKQHAPAKCCHTVQNAYTMGFGKMKRAERSGISHFREKFRVFEMCGLWRRMTEWKIKTFRAYRFMGQNVCGKGWFCLTHINLFRFSLPGHPTLATALKQTLGILSTISVMGWLALKWKLTV